MTPRTSAQIAVEIAETLSERLSTLRNLSTIQAEEILSGGRVRDLTRDYERAKALEATAEPAPKTRSWVFAPYHACVLCEAGRCPACDGECKVPALCGECAR